MADYTTPALVKSLFRRIKIEAATGDAATETVITTEELEQFITDAEAEVNAKLKRYYTVPILIGTSPESFKIVEKISRFMAAQVVKGIIELSPRTSERAQSQKIDFGSIAEKMLTELLPWFNKATGEGLGRWEEPITPLPDAVSKSITPFTGALFQTHVNALGEPKPTFTKNGNNW